jgi:hypothetical protein
VPPGDRRNGDGHNRPGLGQHRYDRPHACRRQTFGLVQAPGEAHRCPSMVLARLEHRPLTATAALVWSGDLPRQLQQLLFDTADSIVF